MLPCPAEQGCAGIRAVFSVKEDGNALEGEDGIGFWGGGSLSLYFQFVILPYSCLSAISSELYQ